MVIIFFIDEGECCMEEEEDEEGEEENGDEEEEEVSKELVDGEETKDEMETTNPIEGSVWNQLQNFIKEEGEETLFPPLDGTAFYILTCKVNHSCDPNVRIHYQINPDKGLELQMKAIKPIQPHEELLQSYIDQYLPKADRQKALRDYGFVCCCLKCSNE